MAGVDLMVPALDGPDYVIIEVNEQPGLSADSEHHAVKRFVELLFPDSDRWARSGRSKAAPPEIGGSACAVYTSGPGVVSQAGLRRTTEQRETAVRRLVTTVAGLGVDIATVMEDTYPVRAPTRVGDAVDASLIVVGRGYVDHLGSVVFGRVPAELSFEALRPVAVVPPLLPAPESTSGTGRE